jgi:hypothetical protein
MGTAAVPWGNATAASIIYLYYDLKKLLKLKVAQLAEKFPRLFMQLNFSLSRSRERPTENNPGPILPTPHRHSPVKIHFHIILYCSIPVVFFSSLLFIIAI